MLRRYWLGTLALILLGMALLSAVLSPDGVSSTISILTNKIEFITTSLGWFLFFVQYLYNKSETFYLSYNSFRLWLTNGPTKWNFKVDFYGTRSVHQLEKLNKLLMSQGTSPTTWHKDAKSTIVNFPGYTIRIIETRVQNSFDGHDSVLTVQLSNLELPFRSFRSRIENEIVPLLHEISNIVKPSNQKYVAKIGFSIPNPYFGFFVRKLELPQVVSFTCDLIENNINGNSQNVSVRKDKIEIVTDNLAALQSLSLKYMALSAR